MAKTKESGPQQIYLGDSVYAGVDEQGRINLWLDNGEGPKSVIVMDNDVITAFWAYLTRFGWKPSWGA